MNVPSVANPRCTRCVEQAGVRQRGYAGKPDFPASMNRASYIAGANSAVERLSSDPVGDPGEIREEAELHSESARASIEAGRAQEDIPSRIRSIVQDLESVKAKIRSGNKRIAKLEASLSQPDGDAGGEGSLSREIDTVQRDVAVGEQSVEALEAEIRQLNADLLRVRQAGAASFSPAFHQGYADTLEVWLELSGECPHRTQG